MNPTDGESDHVGTGPTPESSPVPSASSRAPGTSSAAADEAIGPSSLALRASAALAEYRAGRTDLLAALVREATPLLWHIVRSQGVERDEAEDVVQGVWLAFVRNAETIREPDALLKWLVVSARRSAWQVVRRRRDHDRRTTALPDDDPSPAHELRAPGPGPDAPVLLAERDGLLWRRFRELPERCQVLLRFVAAADRPDYKAIAAATGMQVTAVGITRGRCLAKLRALLADDQEWVTA